MPTVNVSAGSDLQLQEIADFMAKSKKFVVITGAGISTNCGIPDFRSENGLYSLIQAQYDAAAKSKQIEEVVEDGGRPVDEFDGRPAKRRRVGRSNFTRESRSLRSSSSIGCLPSSDDIITWQGRDSESLDRSNDCEGSQADENSSNASHTSNSTPPFNELGMLTPPSSQASVTPSNSGRASLPNLKGKDLFDAIIWSDPFTTSLFYTFISSLKQTIFQDVTETSKTHKFIRSLRDAGRLVRNYTQNIDMLEVREGLCADLEKGTGRKSRFSRGGAGAADLGGVEVVQLHGCLDELRCGLCSKTVSWDEVRMQTTLSGESPDCPHCQEASEHREGRGRRSLAVGRLRPDVVLYGEEHPLAHLIGDLVTDDLSIGPDLLLIMGTSLRVHGLKVLVREFAKAVRDRGGIVVYVNQTKPPESIWGDIIDYHVEWDCDKWVDDLEVRKADIWLPPPTKPSSTRPDVTNGAHCVIKIMETLACLSGRSMLWTSKSMNDSIRAKEDEKEKARDKQVAKDRQREEKEKAKQDRLAADEERAVKRQIARETKLMKEMEKAKKNLMKEDRLGTGVEEAKIYQQVELGEPEEAMAGSMGSETAVPTISKELPRKRKSEFRPKAVRDNKENGAYCTLSILSSVRRLSNPPPAVQPARVILPPPKLFTPMSKFPNSRISSQMQDSTAMFSSPWSNTTPVFTPSLTNTTTSTISVYSPPTFGSTPICKPTLANTAADTITVYTPYIAEDSITVDTSHLNPIPAPPIYPPILPPKRAAYFPSPQQPLQNISPNLPPMPRRRIPTLKERERQQQLQPRLKVPLQPRPQLPSPLPSSENTEGKVILPGIDQLMAMDGHWTHRTSCKENYFRLPALLSDSQNTRRTFDTWRLGDWVTKGL